MEYVFWNLRSGICVVYLLLLMWSIGCGPSVVDDVVVEYLLWDLCCGLFVVEKLLWSSCCFCCGIFVVESL